MKIFKFLIILFVGILLIPNTVFAEESKEEENQKVNIYFFYGDGCGYCASAEEFFESIQEEYGNKFNLVMYETWNDTDNAELMDAVADARKEEPQGVPYIIIGDQSWQGYDSTYNDEIIDKIEAEYKVAVDNRYDIMNYVDGIDPTISSNEESYAGDIAAVIAILLVVSGVGLGIWYARSKAS